MKKLNVIPLIALLCLLFSCIIGIFDVFIEIPLALRVCNILLVLVASILSLIFVKKQDKNNKK